MYVSAVVVAIMPDIHEAANFRIEVAGIAAVAVLLLAHLLGLVKVVYYGEGAINLCL